MDAMREYAEVISGIREAIDQLAQRARLLKLSDVTEQEWYQLITQKLLPQLTDQSYLVIAVVGGTNLGKSVVFNHLCGKKVRATSPLASGTKHPTCLVPPRFANPETLQKVFKEFELKKTQDANDALTLTEQDILFWKENEQAPSNLLVLDTPDIDSDAEVNWSRADKVRRSADLLVAVLTQQKYNDAAVKKFFRTAAQENKAVLVVFNQCLLPDDDQYWPIWLETFCTETGVSPEFVYVAPHDRKAAEDLALPFFSRPWPVSETDIKEHSGNSDNPRNLMEDISGLRFETIKLRSLEGALNTIQNSKLGIPVYLDELKKQAGIYGDARKRLTDRLQEIHVNWPKVPNRVIVSEIRSWWKEQRTGWEASVHGFYDLVGKGIMWPVNKLRGVDPEEMLSWDQEYREQEWNVLLTQLSAIYDRIDSLSQHGNPVLAPRMNTLLEGNSREETIAKLQKSHQGFSIREELKGLISEQMNEFRKNRSDWFRLLKRLDSVAAAARPVLSVALFATGVGPVGNAVMPVMADTAVQTAMHVAGDVTAGTLTAAVGETAISSGASTGTSYLEAWFLQLHKSFVESRKTWLLKQLQEHLWGSLLQDLELAAQTPQSEEFKAIGRLLSQLKTIG